MGDDINRFLPLSPASLHILVALAGGELHGYGIMQEVHAASEGRYKLGPGTLYDNLQRLLDDGLVQETARRDADSRRRYYRLTSLGKAVVAAEIERLEAIFKKVKSQIYGRQPRKA